MENYEKLCPVQNNTYENISEAWYKLSPESTELYIDYLIPLELKSEEHKGYIREFIMSFSEAFCLKQSGNKYRELIDKGVRAIYLCLARTSLPPCEKKKIKQLLSNIQYNLYYNQISENKQILSNISNNNQPNNSNHNNKLTNGNNKLTNSNHNNKLTNSNHNNKLTNGNPNNKLTNGNNIEIKLNELILIIFILIFLMLILLICNNHKFLYKLRF